MVERVGTYTHHREVSECICVKSGVDDCATLSAYAVKEFSRTLVEEHLKCISEYNKDESYDGYKVLSLNSAQYYTVNFVLFKNTNMDAQYCNTQDEFTDCAECNAPKKKIHLVVG